MKYSVVAVTNGNFNIHSEHGDAQGAIMEFHGYCKALWNDKDTTKAAVRILDENLDVYEGYTENISHSQDATTKAKSEDTGV